MLVWLAGVRTLVSPFVVCIRQWWRWVYAGVGSHRCSLVVVPVADVVCGGSSCVVARVVKNERGPVCGVLGLLWWVCRAFSPMYW